MHRFDEFYKPCLSDEKCDTFRNTMQDNIAEAAQEFSNHQMFQEELRTFNSSNTVHLVFVFIEKVLMPPLLRQPGQL